MIPLITRNPVSTDARFVKPVAISIDTKKLNRARLMRILAEPRPRADARSLVESISALESWKKPCALKPPPNRSRAA